MDWLISIVCLVLVGSCLELLARRHDRGQREVRHRDQQETYDAPYVFSYSKLDFRFIELYTPNPTECEGPDYRFDANGFRLDHHNVSLSKDAASEQIWIFGGSTTMGLCVKENQTVSAYVNDLLEAGASKTRVVNMGIGGFSSTNELLLLIELLQAGYRPKAVLIYDGINEKPTSRYFRQWEKYSEAADRCRLIRTGMPRELRQLIGEFILWLKTNVRSYNYLAELRPRRIRARGVTDGLTFSGNWDVVVAQYVENLLMIRGICEVRGIVSMFFFQPVLQYELHYKIRELSDYESAQVAPHCRQDEFRRREILYQSSISEISDCLGEDHVDFYDVFRGRDGVRLYDDPRHPNARANHIVAAEIYKRLSRRMKDHRAHQ